MRINSLRLVNFRSYTQAEFSFAAGVNIIQGDNALGKTNLLEALYLIATGRSFRTPRLAELIRTGADAFHIEVGFTKEEISQTASITYDKETRKVKINSSDFNLFSALLGLIPTVVYAPGDVGLISGSPSERRRFLDMQIAQVDPLYVHHLTRYLKAMKQRNHMLKMQTLDSIEVWEQLMATSAKYVEERRRQAIIALRAPLREEGARLTLERDSFSIRSQSCAPEKLTGDDLTQYFIHAFRENRPKEQILGFTLSGPHRDDLLFLVNKKNAKLYASEGQKRSLIAALRLAEWRQLADELDEPPVLSVDDFGIHLDPERTERLQSELAQLGQVFITTPKALDIGDAHTIAIKSYSEISCL